jgi:Icc-related predicted phosphoesterase
LRSLITNGTLLLNESTIVGPARVWASPQTVHYGGAFGRSNAADRLKAYASIPLDTDILVTHGPPYGILDSSPDEYPGPAGDRELRDAVIRVRPRLHVFGHVHCSYGLRTTRHTTFINAALFDLDGSIRRPLVVEMSKFKQRST